MIPIEYDVPDVIDASVLLEKGAAYIEEVGWHQGHYWPRSPDLTMSENLALAIRESLPVCAIGSLEVAAGEAMTETSVTAEDLLARHLGCNVPDWNDAPDQTAENVVATMRACATRLRGDS